MIYETLSGGTPNREDTYFSYEMPSKNPRIRVAPEVLRRLKEMQREGESDYDVVQRLLDGTTQGMDTGLGCLPEEDLTHLKVILDVLGEPLTLANLAGAALKMWVRLGTALGYGEDTGLDEKQRDIVVSFFEDDDPTHTRMRLAIGSLQQLINRDGAFELRPHLDDIVELFCVKVSVEKAVKA
jgi:predicted CopG family antitoxin